MRLRSALLVLAVAACGSGEATETTSPTRAAQEYAASAQRALEGTAFASATVSEVAAWVDSACSGLGSGSVRALAEAVGGSATTPGDLAILVEVFEVGLEQVCPERAATDLTDPFLSLVHTAGLDPLPVSDNALLVAAPLVCEALESENVAAAFLIGAGSLYGADSADFTDLASTLSDTQGFTLGAMVSASAALLCPEHADVVAEFVGAR